MATTVKGNLVVRLDTECRSILDEVEQKSDLAILAAFNFTSGTGAAQVLEQWSDDRQIGASGTDDIDLAGGITSDVAGTTIIFTAIKLIMLRANSANTNDCLLGGAASAQFVNWVSDATDVVVIEPGGLFLLYTPSATGYAVGAGSSDLLRVTNSAGATTVNYKIYVLGEV